MTMCLCEGVAQKWNEMWKENVEVITKSSLLKSVTVPVKEYMLPAQRGER